MTVVHIDKTSRRKKDRNKFSVYTRRDTIIEEKKSIMSKISSMKLNSYTVKPLFMNTPPLRTPC